MKRFTFIIFGLLVLTTGMLLSQPPIDYKPFPEYRPGAHGSSQYYLYTPRNIPSGHLCPIVLYLHGCCGASNNATPRDCVDPGARVWHNFGANTQPEPTFIMAGTTESGWSQHETDFKAVIDSLVAAKVVDPKRIYIDGFSMGGAGTWQFVEDYPTYFAAASPMGCNPSTTASLKNIPVFQNDATLDAANDPSVNLPLISTIRKLNGYDKLPNTWETGVNPLMHYYYGPHGAEQFMSTQELGYIYTNTSVTPWYSRNDSVYQTWMLTKINDGNQYPSVWFETPNFIQQFPQGSTIPVEVKGTDDGSVAKIQIFVNRILQATVTPTDSSGVYIAKANIKLAKLETLLEATATDNLGKTTTSSILIRTNAAPIITTSDVLPEARMGAAYYKRLFAFGNEPLTYKITAGGQSLPSGLVISSDQGIIKGIPLVSGTFKINITVLDVYNDSVNKTFALTVLPKKFKRGNGYQPTYNL
jgi:pimeloyl-ACP methyl ester carboxylesterase